MRWTLRCIWNTRCAGSRATISYTLGSELRRTAQRLCRLVARVNDVQGAARWHALDELVHAVEEMKTLLTLAKEIGAFGSFNDFARAAELAVSLGKQSGGWRRRVRPEAASRASVPG